MCVRPSELYLLSPVTPKVLVGPVLVRVFVPVCNGSEFRVVPSISLDVILVDGPGKEVVFLEPSQDPLMKIVYV